MDIERACVELCRFYRVTKQAKECVMYRSAELRISKTAAKNCKLVLATIVSCNTGYTCPTRAIFDGYKQPQDACDDDRQLRVSSCLCTKVDIAGNFLRLRHWSPTNR